MTADYDPTDLRGEAQMQAKREDADRLARMNEQDDIRWLMSSRRGRRIAWWLLDWSGVFRLSYTGEATETVFREGMRNVGLRLMSAIVETSPGHYATMLSEHQKDERAKHGTSSSSDDGRSA